MMKPRRSTHDSLPLFLLLALVVSLVLLGGSGSLVRAETPGIELSFDDGADGTADDDDPPLGYPLQNTASEGSDTSPFPPSGPVMILTLEGDAHRSIYGEGKYGRAADLDGDGDSILASNLYTNFEARDLHAWWWLRSAESGVLWSEPCRFEVGLSQGKLYVGVWGATCQAMSITTSNLSWPSLNSWHHLSIHREESDPAGFLLRIDFGPPGGEEEVVTTPAIPLDGPMSVEFGRDVDGLVDELQAANYPPGAEAQFDYDPTNCGVNPASSTVCEEFTARALSTDLTQPSVTWDLPVRYKLIFDSQACSAPPNGTPCEVVFAWSGGGACANNYIRDGDEYVEKLVAEGLAVVTADPICWTHTWTAYPDETIQFLAVKDHVASNGFLDLSEYYATGCSNGAINVLKWAVLDDHGNDHPKRTFARSAGGMLGDHPDCEYHESWCGEKQKIFDEGTFGEAGDVCQPPLMPAWPHPHEPEPEECVDLFWAAKTPFIENITDQLVNIEGREIGRSWGTNDPDQAPFQVCTDPDPNDPDKPTEILCSEEGGLGATDGGRWFRDKWREVEDSLNPTGYFIEDKVGNCRHCALDFEQLVCIAEYIAKGRANMSQECRDLDVPGDPAPDCADYPL